MITFNQERHIHIGICITVWVFRKKKKKMISIANEVSYLAFLNEHWVLGQIVLGQLVLGQIVLGETVWGQIVLGNISSSIVGINFGVLLREKRPRKPESASTLFAYSLMIYTGLIEYNIVGDTIASMLRCFLFFKAES